MLTIEQVDGIIKEVFNESLVRSVDSVYELSDDSKFNKLVISIHNIVSEDTLIIHTKLIFKTDLEKINLIDNSVSYLYDLNCIYKSVSFESSDDMKRKLADIIDSNDFGQDIRNISEFIETPALSINDYLKRSGQDIFSVHEVKYDPKYKIMPCEFISFDFHINVDNTYQVDINFSKKGKDDYNYQFKFMDDYKNVSSKGTGDMVDIIGTGIYNMLENIIR